MPWCAQQAMPRGLVAGMVQAPVDSAHREGPVLNFARVQAGPNSHASSQQIPTQSWMCCARAATAQQQGLRAAGPQQTCTYHSNVWQHFLWCGGSHKRRSGISVLADVCNMVTYPSST
jgi:hypothetical protein